MNPITEATQKVESAEKPSPVDEFLKHLQAARDELSLACYSLKEVPKSEKLASEISTVVTDLSATLILMRNQSSKK